MIPERLRQDFSLSEGNYIKGSADAGDAKSHLSYKKIGVALGVAANEFQKSRLVVVQSLR